MTARERVLASLEHRQPDRIPVYFGGTSSFLTDAQYYRLKEYLGIKGDVQPYRKGHTGTIYDPRILDALGVDVRFLVYRLEDHGIREIIDEDHMIDEWGILLVRSGNMWSRMSAPLKDADVGEIREYQFPDPGSDTWNEDLEQEAKNLREQTEYALVARSVHSASFMELGCWLRGSEDFLCELVMEEETCHVLLDKIMQTQMRYYEVFLKKVGRYVDIVETSEDFGTQQSLFLSPQTYRDMIMPRRQKINAVIHKYAPQAKILHHSCGAIRKLIPDLIETGIDILNPIQPNLPGMDARELKEEFGDKICFCGGIDMQHAINGSYQDIDREVIRCKEQLGQDGGYFYSTSNHIQEDTPVENVMRLFEDFQRS